MVPDRAEVRAVVRGNRFAGLENREERLEEIGNPIEHRGRLRAQLAARLRLRADGIENEHLPFLLAARNALLTRIDVVIPRQIDAAIEERLDLGFDRREVPVDLEESRR